VKFVITGSAGHISKPLTEILLARGHEVTVVSRKPENVASLVARGAKAAIGDLADIPFLSKAFRGADGVYLMVPPSWQSVSIKQVSQELVQGFAAAVRETGVRNIVYLSSYGAHRWGDAGAISGLGLGEAILNQLDNVNVLSLRAGYFYTNLLFSIRLIKEAGHMGNMFAIPEGDFTLVDTGDIAVAAADALTKQDFKGHSFQYVVSHLSGTDEIASIIGNAIGKPDLKWVKLPAGDVKNVLLGFGFAEGAANDYVEMFAALDKGVLFEDFKRVRPALYPTKLETFAKAFAEAYGKS
jgi:uncharacterized protein YbjT (DUF2867 family)